jgi:hypothetical protein
MTSALVTGAEVKQIYPTNSDVSPFIDVAHVLVTEELAASGLSDSRKAQIEKYLAAHFALVTLERGGLSRQKIGDAEDYYQIWNNREQSLSATRFGQQALILDTTGTLASLGTNKLTAQFRVVSANNNE